MNRLTYIYRSLLTAAIVSTLLAASSCKKFLDVVPSELVTSDQVWGNINNANGVLANLYSKMPGTLPMAGQMRYVPQRMNVIITGEPAFTLFITIPVPGMRPITHTIYGRALTRISVNATCSLRI